MTTISLTFALIGFIAAIFAQHEPKIDHDHHATVSFHIRNAGLMVTGTIDSIKADIYFNREDISSSTIRGRAFVQRLRTGIPIRDRHLQQPDYFDLSHHPAIMLSSTKIKRSYGNRFVGEFDLTIKGIKKNISIPFTVESIEDHICYHARFKINRLDFDLGEKSSVLDNIVEVNIDISANVKAR